MATKNITDENFETEVLKISKPTLVDFWAEWCPWASWPILKKFLMK